MSPEVPMLLWRQSMPPALTTGHLSTWSLTFIVGISRCLSGTILTAVGITVDLGAVGGGVKNVSLKNEHAVADVKIALWKQ